jgi:hypothetical protein
MRKVGTQIKSGNGDTDDTGSVKDPQKDTQWSQCGQFVLLVVSQDRGDQHKPYCSCHCVKQIIRKPVTEGFRSYIRIACPEGLPGPVSHVRGNCFKAGATAPVLL